MSTTTDCNLDAIRRCLCGPAFFLVDDWSVSAGSIALRGWCLSEYPGALELRVSGARPSLLQMDLPSASLAKVFPFYPGASAAAFQLQTSLRDADLQRSYVDIALCDRLIGDVINEWHTVRIPLSTDSLPIPASEQLQRTQGNVSEARYLSYGLTVAGRLDRICRRYFGRPIHSYHSILDWGVGCGRVARYLSPHIPRFFGSDIDSANVAWCAGNIPGQFFVNGDVPPLGLDSNSIELCYAISVFTHLSHEHATQWRDELARVLEPNGVCIITVHGVTGIGRITDDDRLRHVAVDGYDASLRDARLDSYIADKSYYRATYQTPQDVAAFFGHAFELVDHIRGANALLQDFVVLKKRA